MDRKDDSMKMTPDEALQLIKAPEAIMEPEIIDWLRIYLEEGCGCTDTAINDLISGYRAYAQSVNIMSEWLVALGDNPPDDIGQAVPLKKQNVVEEESDASISPTKRYETQKVLPPFYGKIEAAKVVENTLATMIGKNFSPDTADTIFEDGEFRVGLIVCIRYEKLPEKWRCLDIGLYHKFCVMRARIKFAM
ncbi:hypothetical protein DICVIV_02154 [Dictyocaulus viviparus]|uniref:Uncharacterized protein n=1 Tax=Dictyocaulus viviparus TaxID=29172 RepID=A0A0D8Y4F2_DICVI|nr:hypothetical protein DICVIV_02154 [Dictyocaulus viviparus]